MIALFAMIAFVTNLCNPMAKIIKNQGEISTVLAQIGNYGNFVAYLIMGIPAGMLISKFGYKKTALTGLIVGAVGILIQWFSGQLNAQEKPRSRVCRLSDWCLHRRSLHVYPQLRCKPHAEPPRRRWQQG